MKWIFGLTLIAIGVIVARVFPISHGVSGILALMVCIIIACWSAYVNYWATNNDSPAEPSKNKAAHRAGGRRHGQRRLKVDRKFTETVFFSIGTVFVTLISIVIMATVADDPQILYGLAVSGNVESNVSPTGTIVMDFPLKAGASSMATFRTSYPDVRYLNSGLALSVNGDSCAGSEVATYVFYSGVRKVAQGAISTASDPNEESQADNIPIGTHESLRIDVYLHAPTGCNGDFSLVGPTIDRVTGWQHDVAEIFTGSGPPLPT
jgi:hypothetical protein